METAVRLADVTANDIGDADLVFEGRRALDRLATARAG